MVDIYIRGYSHHLGDIVNDFETLIAELEGLSTDEKADMIKKLEGDCVCPTCPTYNDCAKDKGENVFCITGESQDCINMELGCLCPTCPLAQKYKIGMMYNFYCQRGTETKQREG
jgi:hypothetical protein